MPVSMYSVFVGSYLSVKADKNDLAKLSKLGFQGFVFSRNNHYSLKVFSSPDEKKIKSVKKLLEINGFLPEIETIEVHK